MVRFHLGDNSEGLAVAVGLCHAILLDSMFFIVNFRLVSTEEFVSTPCALCSLMGPLRLIIYRFSSSFNHLFVILGACYSRGSSTLWKSLLEH